MRFLPKTANDEDARNTVRLQHFVVSGPTGEPFCKQEVVGSIPIGSISLGTRTSRAVGCLRDRGSRARRGDTSRSGTGLHIPHCRWARVLAFEPPHRLVFSRDIGPQWKLEHRPLDRHGDGWEGERDAVAGEQGWPLYLERFTDVLEA